MIQRMMQSREILWRGKKRTVFLKNKTGSYINFLSKNNTRAYFRGISFIFIYQKQICKVENYEIFKYTKYENRYLFTNK